MQDWLETLRAALAPYPGAYTAVVIAALLLAALVVALLASLLAVLGGAIHPALGALLTMLTMLGFAGVVLVLVVGAAYLAWRDTFGEAAAPPALPAEPRHGIEV